MCSGGHDGCSSRWDEEAATLEAIEQRVKLFVSSSKQERDICVVLDFSSRSTKKETQFDMSETSRLIHNWKQLMDQVLKTTVKIIRLSL